MAKTDWKAEAKALKKKLKKKVEALTSELEHLRSEAGEAVSDVVAAVKKAAKPVSSLAPAAFPTLPVIKGAAFAWPFSLDGTKRTQARPQPVSAMDIGRRSRQNGPWT